jgi:UDP-glucose:(glucosyl)LPS alpha-1,2-glucosyltransferase
LAKENLPIGDIMADWLQRIQEPQKQITAMGGSEILKTKLYEYTDIEKYDNLNLLMSTPSMGKIKFTKKNILWQHLNYTDESLGELKNPSFIKSLDAQVYVSHWQYEKFRYVYQIPTDNSYVIKNAIDPIEFKDRDKKEKIKLIYTSTPFRGLEVLLDSFEALDRDDIELDVYSSTLVYGSGYVNHTKNIYDHLFDRAKSMKNVNYMGYAPNEDIHQALQDAHIFAYPSVFEETCCLAMVEAGAAGCDMVTTDLGALFETGAVYAKMIPIQSTKELLVKKYTEALNESIDNYWDKKNQERLKEQSDFYNKYYSWDKRKVEWNNLFERLSND